MNQSQYEQNCSILTDLMRLVSISSLEELSKVSGVSGLQIRRLQYGLIYNVSVETIVKLGQALQLSVEELIAIFTQTEELTSAKSSITNQGESAQFWQQEYQQLEEQLEQQVATLNHKFQQDSINAIESWLIQWPTAIAAIEKNPDLPAERLIPLVKPVKELVSQWGLETIATVGEQLPYDPQWHELMNGAVEPGTMVKVRYVGYQQKDKILYKAKVSPIEES